MSKVRVSNRERLLNELKNAGENGLTTERCLSCGGSRFGARIGELRRDGWDIETLSRVGTELARYIFKGRIISGQIPLF